MPEIQNQLQYLSNIIQPYFGSFGFVDVPGMMVLFALLAIFLFGMTFGRARVLMGLLSVYVGRLVETNFIYFSEVQSWLPNIKSYWLHFLLFVIFTVLAFILIRRSAGGRLSLADSSILTVTALSILTIGFLISISLTYLPSEVYSGLDHDLLQYFTTKTARFWWAVLPMLSLFFVRRYD